MTGDFAVIPAIDIRGGNCVRLYRGLPGEETVFSGDPLEVAESWQSRGAAMLHVVDLDGAFEGEPVNGEVVERIVRRLSIPVQVGGGIRSAETARYYTERGVARVVMGTTAFSEPDLLADLAGELGERLVAGVDVRDGQVAVSGWTASGGLTPLEAVRQLTQSGVRRIIYTDISRDGTLDGPNFEGIERVAVSSAVPVIASGGVGDLEDIARISDMRSLGVEGVIVGMALYRKRFTLGEALLAAAGRRGS